MNPAKKRVYRSPIRQQQADETRAKIVAAARRLLEERGYAGMTIEAIGQEAGVAVATVYAVFGSKTAIVSAMLEAARSREPYRNLVSGEAAEWNSRERLRDCARIARRMYEPEGAVLDLLRGAGAVAPELARHQTESERLRYAAQKLMIGFVEKAGDLRPGLDPERARDILWVFTSRDLYRMLVRDRGWTAQEYEDWLAGALMDALLAGGSRRGAPDGDSPPAG